MIKIGSARHDEYGSIGSSKTRPGDQANGSEVEIQNFYVHPKKWYVYRLKDVVQSAKLAERMAAACSNNNIGYNQLRRHNIMKDGIDSKVPTECDCSSLVRRCIYEACGVDVGNFTTATADAAFKKSGLFKDRLSYKAGLSLYDGDILCTQTKGHVVIVTSGNSRIVMNKEKSVDDLAWEVIAGKWGIGHTNRRFNLEQAGYYNYEEIRARVNELMRK